MRLRVSLFIILVLLFSNVPKTLGEEAGKLVMIQELFRHGARYPSQVLGIGDEYAAQERSLGELTSEGKAMHYLLGKKLYETYWDRLFANTPFQYRYNQSKFLVKSTNFNRTIESAQSHLAGILQHLPPLNISAEAAQYSSPPYPGITAKKGFAYGEFGHFIHPIYINATDRTMTAFQDGDFLARWDSPNCPKMNQWSAQNFKTPQAKKAFSNKEYIAAVNELGRALGKKIDMNNFIDHYDNLICMYYQGREVPSIFYTPSETQEALKSLYLVSNYLFYTGNQIQTRAQASDILAQTIANMKKVQNDTYSSPQWVIFSAHDITIAAILAVTNLWNFDCLYNSFLNHNYTSSTCIPQYPIFATDLIFQLYQYTPSRYTFKINYNGHHIRIPFCEYQFECPFAKLQEFYQKVKVSNIRATCGAPYYYTKEMLYALMGAVIVLLSWYILIKIRGLGGSTQKLLADQKTE